MNFLPTDKSVAVLIDYHYRYQACILAGIRAALNEAGLASTVYLGRELNTQDGEFRGANDIYGLVSSENHLGVIVLSGNLGNQLSDEAFAQFLARYHPLPVVTVGRALPGFPCVQADNVGGMQRSMNHLIGTRGFRRFAFVRGLPGNVDSAEREGVFCQALERHGLTPRPELMVSGNYSIGQAYEGVTRLCQQTRDFEVVVSVNDEMTEGIIAALRDQGLRVPEDVAVVGFDDSDPFRHAFPPLTTVRQPLFEQGEAAVQLLLSVAGGELSLPAVSAGVLLQPPLIVRQSCGASAQEQSAQTESDAATPARYQPAGDRQGERERGGQERVWASLERAAQDGAFQAAFLTLWKDTLLTTLQRDEELHPWQAALQRAHAEIGPHLGTGLRADFHKLCAEAHAVLYDALQLSYARRHDCELAHTALSAQMYLAPDYERLLSDLSRYLLHFNMRRAVLVLYEAYEAAPCEYARVALAQGTEAPKDPGIFRARQLLPASMRGELLRGHTMLSPLFVEDEHYGYLLYDQPTGRFSDEETPRHTISRAIKQLEQAHALRHHLATLEQQVQARTRQLEDEIKERLKAEDRLRVANQELQRSASLDGLTGLNNRAAFDDALEQLWTGHAQHGQPLSLILCDVDFFKKYNDFYGHLKGDQCLREVSRALERAVRRSDIVARYGGEEFVAILPDTDAQGAGRVAARISEELLLLRLPHEKSEISSFVTLSCGVSTLVPGPATSSEQLVDLADQRLYQAKRAGRAAGVT